VRASFDDAFRSAATVFPALERLGVPIQIFVCTKYARDEAPLTIPELAGDDPEQLATMSWDELRAHVARGVAIGSHGVSHAHLTRLSDDELRRELTESKEAIEAELGRPCPEFAYPYGEHDERVRAAGGPQATSEPLACENGAAIRTPCAESICTGARPSQRTA
jgi:peptidoglycan/xylan/chitin deacetylase (PgdA/CDA1 family)